MFGRFCHFYPAYTAEAALAMPWSRFQALLATIPQLRAEDDLRQTMNVAYGAHPGEKGKQLQGYQRQLEAQMMGERLPVAKPIGFLVGTPGVRAAEPGSIAVLRAKQKASYERMKTERAAQHND